MSMWGRASAWMGRFLIPLHNLYLFFRQPIQHIDSLIDLGIHLCNLSLQSADSIQIILRPHGLTLFLQRKNPLEVTYGFFDFSVSKFGCGHK